MKIIALIGMVSAALVVSTSNAYADDLDVTMDVMDSSSTAVDKLMNPIDLPMQTVNDKVPDRAGKGLDKANAARMDAAERLDANSHSDDALDHADMTGDNANEAADAASDNASEAAAAASDNASEAAAAASDNASEAAAAASDNASEAAAAASDNASEAAAAASDNASDRAGQALANAGR
jgi:hypothetical protein